MKLTAVVVSVVLVAPYGWAQKQSGADRLDPNAAVAPAAAIVQTGFVPMSGAQRVEQYFKDTFSPLSFVGAAASAGIGQWRGRPREWKEGDEAFGRRYGSAFAEHIASVTMSSAMAGILHEDNRYLPSQRVGFGARLGYAVTSTFLARHDDGTRHFSFSRIFGYAGAASASRLWQPRSSGTVHAAGINLGAEIGVAVGFNVAREFLFHRHLK